MKQRIVDLSELARIEQDANYAVFVNRSGRRSVKDGIDHVVDRGARRAQDINGQTLDTEFAQG